MFFSYLYICLCVLCLHVAICSCVCTRRSEKGIGGLPITIYLLLLRAGLSLNLGFAFSQLFLNNKPQQYLLLSVPIVTWMLRSKSGLHDCSASTILPTGPFFPLASGFLNMEHLLFESWLTFSIVTECCHVVLLVWVVHSQNSMEQEFVMSNI